MVEVVVGWGKDNQRRRTNFVPELGAIQSKGCSSSYHQSTRNNEHPRAQIFFLYILGEQTYQSSIIRQDNMTSFYVLSESDLELTRDSLLACQLYDILRFSNQSNVGNHGLRGFATIAVFFLIFAVLLHWASVNICCMFRELRSI